MITTYKSKDVKKNTTSYSDSLLLNRRSKKNNNSNNNNNTYIYPDDVAINSLDLADGLKELLIKYGFTLEVLLSMQSSETEENAEI